MSEISCDDVLTEIEHYLHGELDPVRSTRLAAHLSSCSPCFHRAEFQRKLMGIIRTKCRTTATPEHLLSRIREGLRAEADARREDS